MKIDFTEIIEDGEVFESFARDLVEEMGFRIESPPDRGADQGKDLLITEHLTGILDHPSVRWLVSCKHYAHSGRSVSEKDEQNILERLSSFGCSRFLGIYSTLPSAGLNTRLYSLQKEQKIQAYRILDGASLESLLHKKGYSTLLHRYFPESYKAIKPLHLILDHYIPLNCDECGQDLLEASFNKDYHSVIVYVTGIEEERNKIYDIYFACKGSCDQLLRTYHEQGKKITRWEDIHDLFMPTYFLRWLLVTLNTLHSASWTYLNDTFQKEKHFIMAMSQKVFREMTEKERDRTKDLLNLSEYGL